MPPPDSSAPDLKPKSNLRSGKLHLRLSRSPRSGRLQIVNHLLRAADDRAGEIDSIKDKLEAAKYPLLAAFMSSNVWPWIWNYLKNAFSPRAKFRTYENAPTNGVYELAAANPHPPIKLAIAGDWGTGTEQSFNIAERIKVFNADLTIHLGDVYYVGDDEEIEEKCFGKPAHGYAGVNWPLGAQGSFALNGNHEMYANGRPYYEKFLSRVGMRGRGQIASFFCLNTPFWRIIALDTGYNSVGIPILSAIPGIKQIPFIGGDCHLEKEFINWLKTTVRPDKSRATILMSHHQYFSAFPNEESYQKPGKQLAKFLTDQDFVWLWGHEHRLAIYEKYQSDNLSFFGRCIGHSGMPVELATPKYSKAAPLQYYDTRTQPLQDGVGNPIPDETVGINGYLQMIIDGNKLKLDYRDETDQTVLMEEFTNAGNGKISLQQSSIRLVVP